MCKIKISCTGIFAILFIKIFTCVNGLQVSYDPPKVNKLFVDDKINVSVSIQIDEEQGLWKADDSVSVETESETVVTASTDSSSWSCDRSFCNGTVEVTGIFLGFGKVFVLYKNSSSGNETVQSSTWEKLEPGLDVTVIRPIKFIQKLFSILVTAVLTINYINFGCAIDIDVVKKVLRKPIGPAVGFACQFIFMPLLSYGAGYFLFTDPILRLGLFTFGSSPGGGASNMWTVLFGGNLNLSITMTFVSTFAAFGTLPFWLFTLGQTIVKDTAIVIPYGNIMISLVSLVIPIVLGLLIQKYFPKIAARSKKLLAPICIILLIGIVISAALANTYIIFMLTWQMVIAASLSVWTGFLVGILVSLTFRFESSDLKAVAVETGIQNSGIAYMLLNYSLEQPISDLAVVVPVAGSIITPIPLFAVWCYMKAKKRWSGSDKPQTGERTSNQNQTDEYRSDKDISSIGLENQNDLNVKL